MTRATKFIKAINENQLQDLLKIPFYLVNLVELYKVNSSLPPNKSDIFHHLLITRIHQDIEHFRTTITLDDKRKRIIKVLERVALSMEALGRNYITDDEYQRIVPDPSERSLIQYCTVWKKAKREERTWQFEHNNFQEFLAARILSEQPLDVIKDFIAFRPKYRKVIPSWINTLSFLISILHEKNPLFEQILDWIGKCEPELVANFEPDKIDVATRVQIVKNIFNYYKERKIWIDRERYQMSQLARFGQSNETINFLLSEIESGTHYTTVADAIELLGNSDIRPEQQRRVTSLLSNCSISGEYGEQVQTNALMALANLNLNSEKVTNRIVNILRSSNNDWVRFGLYYFLHEGDYLDQNIDVFLDGIRYVRFVPTRIQNGEPRLSDEHWHLSRGIEKVKSQDAILKIFKYFKENPKDLDDPYFEKRMSPIVDNAALAYSKDHSILDIAVDLFVALVHEHLEEQVKKFAYFFDKTNTRFQSFKKVFSERSTIEDSLHILASLADEKAIEFFAAEYNKTITDDDVWTFQNYLNWNNNELFNPFNKLINKLANNKFTLPPKIDFEEQRKQRREHDISLLFDKQAFLSQLKLIFDNEHKQTFTRKELIVVATQNRNKANFSEIARRTLIELAGDKAISLDNASKFVNRAWDLFWIRKVYQYVTGDTSLSNEQNKAVAEWCFKNLDKVDFKTAIVPIESGQTRTSEYAIYLWYFLRKLKLKYPKNILLDMLSFDWIEGSQMFGIQYLEDLLDGSDMTVRALENLNEGIENYNVLKNHIDYCKRNRIYEALPFTLREIANEDADNEVRNASLEAFCELSEDLAALEELLPVIKDEFLWNVVDKLVESNSRACHSFLLETQKSASEDDQFKASEYLISMEDLIGLEHYVELIRKHKKFPHSLIRKSPLSALHTDEAIPTLIKLLEISYQEDLVQDEFMKLDQTVLDSLSTIGIQSERNYFKVKEAVESFIDKYSTTIRNVNFLHAFINRLEQRYYVSKSQELDIDDVLKKLETV